MTVPRRPRYAVKEHFARTHHFDSRLEREGVSKSWVLRKPIPQTAGVRRLAIAVENHDLSFGDFEGEIARGEYGAGSIMLWDRGTYMPSRWGEDRITFELFGDRLAGTYTLSRFVRAEPDQWLLFKHKD